MVLPLLLSAVYRAVVRLLVNMIRRDVPGRGIFSDECGRGGLSGRAHRDRGGPSAHAQSVFQRPRSDGRGRDRGPDQNEVEQTRVGDAEFSATDDLLSSLSARAQGGRGFEIPLPHVGRIPAIDASSSPHS